jgi:hypothetical protein
MNEPHQHRQVAESFGSNAERYDGLVLQGPVPWFGRQ